MEDRRRSGGAASPRMHHSSHPELPPAQASQVVQWLLAKNYYLTALELLVESQQAGKHEEVADLQRFFSDPDKFPPEELSKHQNANALDVQAQAKEREERLQLVEYELRLAKEDLAEMHKRLEQAKQAAGSSTGFPHIVPSPSAKLGQQASLASPLLTSHGACGLEVTDGDHKDSTRGGGINNSAAAAGVAMGGSTESSAGAWPGSSGPAGTKAGMQGSLQGSSSEAGPSAQDLQALNAAVLAHLLHQRLRMTALTLQEEVAPGALGPPPGGAGPGQVPGLELWRWMQAAHRAATTAPADAPSTASSQQGSTVPAEESDTNHAGVAICPDGQEMRDSGAGDGQLVAQLRQQLDAALQQLQQLQQQQQQLQQAESGAGAAGSGAAAAAPAGSSAPSLSSAATAPASPPAAALTSTACASSGLLSDSTLAGRGRMSQPMDAALYERLLSLVLSLPDALVRLMPNLTIKTRLELIPLIETLVTQTPCKPEQQVALVSLVLGLVPNPDEPQRQALVQSLEKLGTHFGAPWVAVELLPQCVKQASSPSAERRALAAQLLGALSRPRMLELSTHAHVLLTQLHRLAEDRFDVVREAAVRSVAVLLTHLQYSRQYYQGVEDMVLPLACDGTETVAVALREVLLPALHNWAADADVVSSSLLPKVVAELGRRAHTAVAAAAAAATACAAGGQHQQEHGSLLTGAGAGTVSCSGAPGTYPLPAVPSTGQSFSYTHAPSPPQSAAPSFSEPSSHLALGMGSSYGLGTDRRFPNHDYQMVHQLLSLYMALLPALRHSALRSCPRWALDAAASSRTNDADHSRKQEESNVGEAARPLELRQTAGSDSWQGQAEGKGQGPGQVHDIPSPPSAAPQSALSPHWQHSASSPSLVLRHTRSQPDVREGEAGEAAREGGRGAEALFSAWAPAEQHMQWKSLQWVVQFLVPELLDVCRLVPVTPNTASIRHQLSLALHDTAKTFGPGFATSAIVPLVAAAAGAGPTGQAQTPVRILQTPVPGHIQVSATDLMPRAAEAARVARERVLPHLLAGVLPAAGMLGQYMLEVMKAAGTPEGSWVLETPQEVQTSIAFAAEVHGQQYMGELLAVLEQLAGGTSTASASAPGSDMGSTMLAGSGDGAGARAPVAGVMQRTSLSTGQGLAAVLLAQGLIPGLASAAAEEARSAATAAAATAAAAAAARRPPFLGGGGATTVQGAAAIMDATPGVTGAGSGALLKRRLVPLLMVLLSRGDVSVRVACVRALLDVMMHCGEDAKLVEQVCVVFDGLLEGGSADLAAAVLNCAGRLAAAVAPHAARSAACAGQLEWVLHAVQQLVLQLQQQPPASNMPPPGASIQGQAPSRSLEQQKALAAQLVSLVYAVYSADVRLPRMQHLVTACIESLQRCRHLLSDQQATALAWMSKDKAHTQSPAALSDLVTRGAAASAAPQGAGAAGVAAGPASIAGASTVAPHPMGAGVGSGPAAGVVVGQGGLTAGPPPAPHQPTPAPAPVPAPVEGSMRARFENFRKKLSRRGDSGDAAADGNGPLQQYHSVSGPSGGMPPLHPSHQLHHQAHPGVSPHANGAAAAAAAAASAAAAAMARGQAGHVVPVFPGSSAGSEAGLPPVLSVPSTVSLQYKPAPAAAGMQAPQMGGTAVLPGGTTPSAKSSAAGFFSDDDA